MFQARHHNIRQFRSLAFSLWHRLFHATKMSFELPKQSASYQAGHQHPLIIVAIAKDEARFLPEWVSFHLAVGASKILIYDNMSSDNSREVLEPFLKAGAVEVIPWPHFIKAMHTQAMAYNHALAYAGDTATWMAFIDLDEFLFDPSGQPLPARLDEYKDLPALCVFRHHYGTSGHQTLPDELIIDAFTQRIESPEGPMELRHLKMPKAIVQPSRVRGFIGAHRPLLTDAGIWGHDELRRVVSRNNAHFSADKLRINHYYTKDQQTFRKRLDRKATAPNRSFVPTWYNNDFQQIENGKVEDRAISVWSQATAERMARK